MAASDIRHVTDTAFWVATYRANEGERADALFSDPLAARLVEGRGRAIAAAVPGSPLVGWSVVLRTVIIDEFVLAAIDHGYDAVLNLGAGLDTRPYRLALPPDLLWVEADFASTIDFKEEKLAGEQPRCRLERHRVDLGDAAARRALLADVGARARKILVLTEGVILYLSNADVEALAADLYAQPSVQGWVTEIVSSRSQRWHRLIKRARRRALVNAPLQFEPGDWRAFFRDRGWTMKDVRYVGVEGVALHRPPPISKVVRWLFRIVPKTLRERMQRGFGYMLLGKLPR